MSRIAFINGIHSDGSASTDRLCRALAGDFRTTDVNYPVVRWWQARWRCVQLDRAQRLFDATADGDHIVAHSFGCLLVRRAMQLGRQFAAVFLFAAADASDTYWPYWGAERIYVIHNPYDVAIKWGSKLLNHDFGSLGADGYALAHKDPRVFNIRTPYFRRSDLRHGFYFGPDHIQHWADFVAAHARQTDDLPDPTDPERTV